MTLDEAIKSLMALQAKLAAYGHAMGLLFYDGATTAPKGTAANRGQTMSILSEEHYKLTTGGETVALLEFLDAHKSGLNEKQQRMAFLLIKDIRNMQKIPMDEYVAYQQLLVEADDVWHRAKETSDFALFEPVLEKIFETNIRFAHCCAPEKDPYDYWLSEYEDGLTMAQCDEFFATLREHIVPLLKKIKEKPQVDDAMLRGHFPEEKQAQLSDYLMRTMGLDLDHVGLSTTERRLRRRSVRTLTSASRRTIWRRILPHRCSPLSTRAATRSMTPAARMISPIRCSTAVSPWASTRARAVSMKICSAARAPSRASCSQSSASCSPS